MDLEYYVSLLRSGAVVACPTETLYGLLADALNPQAVHRVCQIKQRTSADPIALLLPSIESVHKVVADFTPGAVQLAERHWPGPLTLVLRAVAGLPEPLIANGKVGIRVPGPSLALELVQAFGGPLTATSANRTGEAPASTAQQVRDTLGEQLDAIVPGNAPGGAPSTVVDVSGEMAFILRSGAIRIQV